MFEILVREAAARYGLGDKALPMLQIVLHYMVGGGSRGLAAFLEKFKDADLGPTVQSWLGGGPAAKPISNEELDKVLGSSDGLISTLTHKLALERDDVTSALGYMLPSLVGKLTPGGSLPSRIPAEVQALAAEGKRLLEEPAARVPQAKSSGGAMKWLPWVIVALAVVLGLGYCSTRDQGNEEAASSSAIEQTQPAADANGDAADAQPAADDAATSAGDDAADADAGADADTGATGADSGDAADAFSGDDDAAASGEDGSGAAVGDSDASDDDATAASDALTDDAADSDADALSGANDDADSEADAEDGDAADTADDADSEADAEDGDAADTADDADADSDAFAGADDNDADNDADAEDSDAHADEDASADTADDEDESANADADSESPDANDAEENVDSAADEADDAVGGADAADPADEAAVMVQAFTSDDKPALKVFFDSGDATVPADFSDETAELVDYLNAHEDARAAVAGYTDASGSAELNEELSKERAQAVRAALVLAGVDEDRVDLKKPQQISDAEEQDKAASRRVEITVED